MINPKDLMLGDLVLWKKKIVKVSSIVPEYLMVVDTDRNLEMAQLEDIEPISLSVWSANKLHELQHFIRYYQDRLQIKEDKEGEQ